MSTAGKTKLQRKLEAEAQKRLAVAQGSSGDENVDPCGRPVATRRGLSVRPTARCTTGSTLADEPFSDNEAAADMNDCTGLGNIRTSQRMCEGPTQAAQPSTPFAGTGNVSQRKTGRSVDVGVDGETPLQYREVAMTPNEERRRRTWQKAELRALREDVQQEDGAETDEDELDLTLEIPATQHVNFRHRDSLMFVQTRRTAGGATDQHDDDGDDDDAFGDMTTMDLRAELARSKIVEKELRAQYEHERHRREEAEARASAFEERMRQQEDRTEGRCDEKDSARVQRLEQQIVDMGAELAKLDSIAAKGDYNAKTTKVVHLKNNPVQKAQKLRLLEESRQQLLRENIGDVSASAEQVDELKKQLAAAEKKHTRLKEVFAKQAEGDYLVFKKPANADFGTLDLVTTKYALTLQNEIREMQCHEQQSSNPPIPNFLSQVTHDLFHQKTMMTQYR